MYPGYHAVYTIDHQRHLDFDAPPGWYVVVGASDVDPVKDGFRSLYDQQILEEVFSTWHEAIAAVQFSIEKRDVENPNPYILSETIRAWVPTKHRYEIYSHRPMPPGIFPLSPPRGRSFVHGFGGQAEGTGLNRRYVIARGRALVDDEPVSLISFSAMMGNPWLSVAWKGSMDSGEGHTTMLDAWKELCEKKTVTVKHGPPVAPKYRGTHDGRAELVREPAVPLHLVTFLGDEAEQLDAWLDRLNAEGF